MIDEKMLFQIETLLALHPQSEIDKNLREELFRLARIGLWAEKHAMPIFTSSGMNAGEFQRRHAEAVAALKGLGIE